MARDQDCSHIENCHSLSVLIQGGHLGQPRVTMAGSKGLAELSALCTKELLGAHHATFIKHNYSARRWLIPVSTINRECITLCDKKKRQFGIGRS